MELIPHQEMHSSPGFNFAPMIDFLFLMLALFATLALSRIVPYDADVTLASLTPNQESYSLQKKQHLKQLHVSISESGSYKWLAEIHEYAMPSVADVQKELSNQYQIGALAKDKTKTEVFLHVDKKAPWDSIATLIFGIRELGFEARPVYEPNQSQQDSVIQTIFSND